MASPAVLPEVSYLPMDAWFFIKLPRFLVASLFALCIYTGLIKGNPQGFKLVFSRLT